MKNNILKTISLMGVLLLSVVFIIEYYNGVIFNNEYAALGDVVLNNKINYLLRTTLWKFHLFSGILLSFIFFMVWKLNKDTWINKLFRTNISILVITGIVNFFFRNDILHMTHIIVSILAVGIYIGALAENLMQNESYV